MFGMLVLYVVTKTNKPHPKYHIKQQWHEITDNAFSKEDYEAKLLQQH